MGKYVKGKDGKFAGSIGDGKSTVPTPSTTPKSSRKNESTAAEPDYAAMHAMVTGPQTQMDQGRTGKHDVYGGYNWGVTYQDYWQDYCVNYGYYGGSEEINGRVHIDGSDIPLADNEVRWTSDQRDENNAVLVWQHRDHITAGLHGRGYDPKRGVRIRAHIDKDAGTIEVSPYDNPNAFEPFTVPLDPAAPGKTPSAMTKDMRMEVQDALNWQGINPHIDLEAEQFTPQEAGIIAGALNTRLQSWPTGSRQSPAAARVKKLYMRFSTAAQNNKPVTKADFDTIISF